MSKHFFDETDLENLFLLKQEKSSSVEKPEKPRPTVSHPRRNLILKFLGLFLAIFILTFCLFNFGAISKNLDYLWKVYIQRQPYQQTLATPSPPPQFDPTTPAQLVIEKINVNAPISWNVNEEQMNDKLLEGVAHYQGTALPGQEGNIFIVGHSSYYSWVSSPYKDVFALLGKLSVGDKIYIQYQDASFTYVVNDTKVVSPDDLSVLEPMPGYNLTLMTCVPVGTNLNRLIVSSTQETSS